MIEVMQCLRRFLLGHDIADYFEFFVSGIALLE